MKAVYLFVIPLFIIFSRHGQSPENIDTPKTSTNHLFESDQPLTIILSGDTKTLLNDRREDSENHSVMLTYSIGDSRTISLNIQSKTRGNYRRQKSNCDLPPLWLKFSNDSLTNSSIFAGQNRLKLVTTCRDDKYVIREYLIYKLYQLVTDHSFLVRPVSLIIRDNSKMGKSSAMFSFIMEDEDKLAERNLSRIIKRNQIPPQAIDRDCFLKMTVFEYLIGNTDWSVQYRHNIKLLYNDSTGVLKSVPYDFDHAGIVSAPYAKPAKALKMRSVRQRRYRGYCLEDLSEFDDIFKLFNKLKNEFYHIYNSSPYLGEKSLETTLEFLDGFYQSINDQKTVKKDFGYPCEKNGTGNVVIKGLND